MPSDINVEEARYIELGPIMSGRIVVVHVWHARVAFALSLSFTCLLVRFCDPAGLHTSNQVPPNSSLPLFADLS